MAINFKAISKELKASENIFVQYTEDGKMAQVSNGKFIAEIPVVDYKKELASALGMDLPSDKAMQTKRSGKKGEPYETARFSADGLFPKHPHTAKKTEVLIEHKEKLLRLYQVDNGENVWVSNDMANFADGEVVGGNRSTPIVISDNGSRVLICPVNIVDAIPGLEAVTKAKTEKVKDEPLSAPTYEEVEEVEEVEEEETEETTDEVDELDSPEEIAKNIVKDDEEEPPTVIDDWTVPSDIFIEVTPNGTMWAIGKTKPERENLKRLGFHYAPKAERAKKAGYPKSAWYRKPKTAEVAAD